MPNSASSTGLSQIIGEPEFADSKQMKQVAQLWEHIDEHASKLVKGSVTAEAFIGREAKFPVPKDLSLVVSNVKLKDGKKGVIGIIGPKPLAYSKKLSKKRQLYFSLSVVFL